MTDPKPYKHITGPIIPLIMSTPETDSEFGAELTTRRVDGNRFRIRLLSVEGESKTTGGSIDLSLQQLRILLSFAMGELEIMEVDAGIKTWTPPVAAQHVYSPIELVSQATNVATPKRERVRVCTYCGDQPLSCPEEHKNRECPELRLNPAAHPTMRDDR
jgi:hypothetical protein